MYKASDLMSIFFSNKRCYPLFASDKKYKIILIIDDMRKSHFISI